MPNLYELKEKPKLYLSNTVYEQIKTLCSEISKVEWSGVLFHKSKGFIDKPETFELRAEYILPMDKGTSGFTSYDFDDDYMDAIAEKPELLNYSISHIHSHNNMSVFFSATDKEELQENAPNYDYYLSLIVNNRLEMEARVAFTGKIKPRELVFKGKNGKLKKILSEEEDVIFYYNMDIEIEYPEVIDEFFTKHLTRIQNKRPKHQQVTQTNDYSLSGGHLNKTSMGKKITNDTNAINFIKYCLSKYFKAFLKTTKSTDSLYTHLSELNDARREWKNWEKLEEAESQMEEDFDDPFKRRNLYNEYLNRGIVFKDRKSELIDMCEESYTLLTETSQYAAFDVVPSLARCMETVLEEFIDQKLEPQFKLDM